MPDSPISPVSVPTPTPTTVDWVGAIAACVTAIPVLVLGSMWLYRRLRSVLGKRATLRRNKRALRQVERLEASFIGKSRDGVIQILRGAAQRLLARVKNAYEVLPFFVGNQPRPWDAVTVLRQAELDGLIRNPYALAQIAEFPKFNRITALDLETEPARFRVQLVLLLIGAFSQTVIESESQSASS